MNQATYQEAEQAAAKTTPPVGMPILTVVMILYYAFELWKLWHSNCQGNQSMMSAKAALNDPDNRHRAFHLMHRAAKHQGHPLTDNDCDTLTEAGLNHVQGLSDQTMGCCCDEPVTLPMGLFYPEP